MEWAVEAVVLTEAKAVEVLVEVVVVMVVSARTAGERDHRRRDERGDAPAEHLEDPLADQHHGQGDRARRRREGAHELRVVVRVGEGHLEARLPRDLGREAVAEVEMAIVCRSCCCQLLVAVVLTSTMLIAIP